MREGFKNAIAGFSIASMYARKMNEVSLPEIIRNTQNRLIGDISAKEYRARFGGEEADYEREVDAVRYIPIEDITLRIEKLITEFKNEYFGEDYEENKTKYILEILERSISS